MLKLGGFVVLVSMLLLSSGAVLYAEDDPAEKPAAEAEKDASPLDGLTEEQLAEETTPEDPIEYLKSFRDWLAKHEVAPPRTRNDSALFDVWRAALRPRATRMRKRIETLMQRKHWLPEHGMPERVKPDSWSRFVREMAALTTELAGALKQYQAARIKIRRGVPAERLRPIGSYYGYGRPVGLWYRSAALRRVLIRRHKLGIHVGPLVLHSYWNLMRRLRAGWGWRVDHCISCLRRREEAQRKKAEDYVAERQKVFDTTRDTLQQQLLALQVLVATMQAQEEHRLGVEWTQKLGDVSERSADGKARVAMQDARLEAEQFTGESSAAYGQLLRGWLRAQKKVVAQLAKASKPDTKE